MHAVLCGVWDKVLRVCVCVMRKVVHRQKTLGEHVEPTHATGLGQEAGLHLQ